jgi:hypothetical protein
VPERPDRMKRNGRAEDQEFQATEKLFRRYMREHYVNGQFSNTGFAFTSPQSVNREKYAEPADVLFSEMDEFADWGVLSFKCEDLPNSFPPENPQYKFATWSRAMVWERTVISRSQWTSSNSGTR